VDGLLQFSRKQIKEEFKIIDLAKVIGEIFEIIRKSFDQKIDIQIELQERLPIIGDLTSLSQALMNLCTNARDAMPDGGRLVVKAVRQEKRIVVTISDNGEGMDRETVEKCFDPFFTTKPIGKGTGLGLSTTYGIIKSHDGLLSVDSHANQGTTFTIQFPLVPGNEESELADMPTIIRGEGQRVLVVDDEPEILKAMNELLLHLGYKAELASSGIEGLEKYRTSKPDAVLMDINMPEMDGITCIEKILDYDPNANISVISGYEQNGIDNIGIQTKKSIKDYLAKPIGLSDLSALLASMLKD
ncbi:MAG: response regulator, partial [Deltaproteobacteria bacterium]|nr:response regulator [Deltaproteobacteria bacterium]